MKKILEGLPFLLLTVITLKSVIIIPSIADALILLSIVLLSGLQYYLNQKKQPDYTKLFTEELKRIETSKISEINKLKQELSEVKELFGKYTVRVNNNTRTSEFEF